MYVGFPCQYNFINVPFLYFREVGKEILIQENRKDGQN